METEGREKVACKKRDYSYFLYSQSWHRGNAPSPRHTTSRWDWDLNSVAPREGKEGILRRKRRLG